MVGGWFLVLGLCGQVECSSPIFVTHSSNLMKPPPTNQPILKPPDLLRVLVGWRPHRMVEDESDLMMAGDGMNTPGDAIGDASPYASDGAGGPPGAPALGLGYSYGLGLGMVGGGGPQDEDDEDEGEEEEEGGGLVRGSDGFGEEGEGDSEDEVLVDVPSAKHKRLGISRGGDLEGEESSDDGNDLDPVEEDEGGEEEGEGEGEEQRRVRRKVEGRRRGSGARAPPPEAGLCY